MVTLVSLAVHLPVDSVGNLDLADTPSNVV